MPKRFNVMGGTGKPEQDVSAARVMQLLDRLSPEDLPLCVFRVEDGEPAPRAERQKRTRNTPV
jgi:hypothetical protein